MTRIGHLMRSGMLPFIFIFILFFSILAAEGPSFAQVPVKKPSPPTVPGKWKTGRIPGAPQSRGYRWFTIDAFNEELHALYFHSTDDHKPNYLIYCRSGDNGRTWSFDTIDGSAGLMAHVDALYSLATFNGAVAVDGCGTPHIFYTTNHFHAGPSRAIHAQKVNGEWIRDTIESRDSAQSMINFDVDMVIGRDNEPRVVYIRGEEEPVFGVRKGGVWQTEPVGGTGAPRYLWNSLALDGRDNPHILLGKYVGLEYGTKDTGGWRTETVFIHTAGTGDIVTDGANRPHITCGSDFNPIFRHAFRDTTGWKVGPLESTPTGSSGSGKRARIKRDREGKLHAVYYGHNDLPEPEYIVYALSTDNGATWKEEIVEYCGHIYAEGGYPDLLITDRLIGIFYKGEGDFPRFAYTEHNKPRFRRSKPNNCGQ